jgi:cell wall assembly regulator SMI1
MKQVTVTNSNEPVLQDNDIREVETKLGISLPSDYKEFLLAHNGGHPQPNAFTIPGSQPGTWEVLEWFFGVHSGEYNNLLQKARVYRSRVPSELLPIATDPGGNLLCLSVSGPHIGKVYFWDHEEEVEEGEPPTYKNVYLVADSFTELVNNLTEPPDGLTPI